LSLKRLRAEPAPAAIAEALDRVAAQNRDMVDIEDRGAAVGDVLTVNFSGSIDGEAFEGGQGTDIAIELGTGGFIPGFTEQLEGMRAGEERTIEVVFPEQYHAAELAGKPAKFHVSASDLKHPVTPDIDDALAVKLGFEDVGKLREAVLGQIQRDYDQMSRLRIKRELLDRLAEMADFPAPETLLETEFGVVADRAEGRVDDDDLDKDDATLKAEYRAIADRRVRLGLLLSEIGRVNHIQVVEAELTQALRAEALRYPGQEMQVIEFFKKNPAAFDQLRGPIFEDKVVDYILEMAQVETETVTPEALSEAASAADLPVVPALKAATPETATHETGHEAAADA
jgi:trigger factor